MLERDPQGRLRVCCHRLDRGTFVVGIAQFDGKGSLTQIDYPSNGLLMMHPLIDFRMGQTGTYAVRANCTGTETIHLNVQGIPGNGVIDNVFVISNGGRSVHGVVAKAIPPFSTTPSPNNTRFDMWRVGSEQDN